MRCAVVVAVGLMVAGVSPSVSVVPDDKALFYVLPGVAHTPGVGGVRWLTGVGVFNPAVTPAEARLTLRGAGGLWEKTLTVPPGSTLRWDDVVGEVFGVPPAGAVAGTVKVVVDQPLVVWGSTYHQGSGGGRLGQPLPVLTGHDGIGPAGGVLPGLPNDDDHRVNLAAVNLGRGVCRVEFRLVSESGEAIGAPMVLSPGEIGWVQRNDVFRTLDPGRLHAGVAHAVVRVLSGACGAWTQASVIDNRSGVSILVPAEQRGIPVGTFVVRVADEAFLVRISDPEVLAQARSILAGRQPQRVVIGDLRQGGGGFNHDLGNGRIWSWHLDPGSVELVDAAIELCDGLPSFVEDDPDFWFNTVGYYCPWLSQIEREVLQAWPPEP